MFRYQNSNMDLDTYITVSYTLCRAQWLTLALQNVFAFSYKSTILLIFVFNSDCIDSVNVYTTAKHSHFVQWFRPQKHIRCFQCSHSISVWVFLVLCIYLFIHSFISACMFKTIATIFSICKSEYTGDPSITPYMSLPEGEVVFALDEDKVCRALAQMLLQNAVKFNLSEFQEVWQQSVPEGMGTRLDQLRVSEHTRAQTSTVFH